MLSLSLSCSIRGERVPTTTARAAVWFQPDFSRAVVVCSHEREREETREYVGGGLSRLREDVIGRARVCG